MRYLILFLLSSFFVNIYSQEWLKDEDGNLYLQMIDSAKGSAASLFSKGKAWVATAFKDGKAVTDSEDKEERLMIISPVVSGISYKDAIGVKSDGYFNFRIYLSFKDSKYRAIIKQVYWEADDMGKKRGYGKAFYDEELPGGWVKFMNKNHNIKQWKRMKNEFNSEAETILASLKAFMSKELVPGDF